MTARSRLTARPDIPRVPWEELGPEFIRWWGRDTAGRFNPEHLTVYGATGGGKTYFVTEALKARHAIRGSYVTVVATKRADSTLTKTGWPVIDTWPPGYGQKAVIYWARAKGISAAARIPQREKIKALMNAIWRENANMVVYWDELTYLEQMLRLRPEIETFYREGRTHGITNVASMQRPSNVTRLAHSEAGWTVVFPPKDADDRKRIAEVLGDRTYYQQQIQRLDRSRYEFIIKRELTDEAYISHLPPPRRSPVARRP